MTLIATTTSEPEANTAIGMGITAFDVDIDEMEIPNPAELLIQELLESNDHVHFITHPPWDMLS